MTIYYFYGEDTYAAREEIGQLADKEEARIRWLDKEDVVEQGAGQLLSQGGGGLFGREIVVVREPSAMAASTQDELVAALKVAPEGVYVLWDRAEPKKRGVVYKEFGRLARQFIVPSSGELVRGLVAWAKEDGVEMDVAAAHLLVERVGLSRWELMSELEKLMLRHKKITEELVRENTSETMQAEIFNVLDALVRGDRERAILGVKTILEEGNSEFYLLSMLAYQLRTLFVVRAAIDLGERQFDVVKEAKMKQYSVQKSWEAAKRRPAAFWREALTRVLATDFAIRQGKVEARTAVLMLVVGLVK